MPDVSVVMGVYNARATLPQTLESILTQRDVDLELIAVNDGSQDGSGHLLDEYAARDARVRVIHQDNAGLTKALVRGCAVSRGRFIARQDTGDLSEPERLGRQVEELEKHPGASLVSCGTRMVGPRGEPLYEVIIPAEEAHAGVIALDLRELRGPASHGSTMFPRALYDLVGGYRSAFYFAQDLDLWTRLAEQGTHIAMPEVLYEMTITPASLSSMHRAIQVETAQLILEAARLRRSGLSEAPALTRASALRPAKRAAGRLTRAGALYFIGECLRRRKDPRARDYFRQALGAFPLHVKSLVRLLSSV